MNKIKAFLLSLAFVGVLAGAAYAAIPWAAVDVQNVTGSTPSPTAFATQATGGSVLIDTMTGNTTMQTLTGGVTGQYYTLVIMQDGTGGRTFTGPAGLTGFAAAEPANVPTAANAYTVCVMKKTGASAFNITACYDNLPLDSVATYSQATLGTTIAPNASQAQPTIVAPGMSVTKPCAALPQTYPATWAVGITTVCIPLTNAMIVDVVNPDPTNTRTPATVTVSVVSVAKSNP